MSITLMLIAQNHYIVLFHIQASGAYLPVGTVLRDQA